MDCDWLSMFFNRSDSDSNYILLLCCYHYRCIPILIELERVLNFIVMSLVQVTFKGTVNMSLKMNIRSLFTHRIFHLQNTKEDILKNVGNHTVVGRH